MKALILAMALVMVATSAIAAEVKLAWDYSGPSDHTFRMYQGEATGQYVKTVDFTTRDGTMTDLEPGKTYYFAVTARSQYGLESDKSNELAVAIPLVPMELRLMVTVSVGK